jgi:hypothetical protein
MRKIVILLFSALALAGCSSHAKRISEKVPPVKQLVLFHYSFINHAWGYQNHGWFINNHGLAMAYRLRDQDEWHDAAESGPDSGYISENDLLADYNQANRVFFEYSHFKLYHMLPFMGEAAQGELSIPAHTSFDRGFMKYTCYQWDSARAMYREVLLGLDGDITQTNLSPAADTLLDWLKDLDPIYRDSLKAWGE